MKLAQLFYNSLQNNHKKETLVILGTGWAGFRIAKLIDHNQYNVIIVSKRNHFVFTPLLASTSVGTLEFRAVTEAIRYHSPKSKFIEANCFDIDFSKKKVVCEAKSNDRINATPKNNKQENHFEISYDKLVVAVGAINNTFNTPGVYENCLFLKQVSDARHIRRRIVDAFEIASQPNMKESDIKNILHFAVVGGGPTGVEFCAELYDLIKENFTSTYSNLVNKVSISLFDVAPTILGTFDKNLSQYATSKLKKRGIKLNNNVIIKQVLPNKIILNNDAEHNVGGLIVWATGVTQTSLVSNLEKKSSFNVMKEKWRLISDEKLQLLDKRGTPIDENNLFALGDCATIRDMPLPATAQVADQQGKYLSKILNKSIENNTPFKFNNMGSMAYLGEYKAIAQLQTTELKKEILPNLKGIAAWIFWKSAYLTKSLSWRNRILIIVHWILSRTVGRDITRI